MGSKSKYHGKHAARSKPSTQHFDRKPVFSAQPTESADDTRAIGPTQSRALAPDESPAPALSAATQASLLLRQPGTSEAPIADVPAQRNEPQSYPGVIARVGAGDLMTLEGFFQLSLLLTFLAPLAAAVLPLWKGTVDPLRDPQSFFSVPGVVAAWCGFFCFVFGLCKTIRACWRSFTKPVR